VHGPLRGLLRKRPTVVALMSRSRLQSIMTLELRLYMMSLLVHDSSLLGAISRYMKIAYERYITHRLSSAARLQLDKPRKRSYHRGNLQDRTSYGNE
jgi:hypothetical protein